MENFDIKDKSLAEGGRRRIKWADREKCQFYKPFRKDLSRNVLLRASECRLAFT